MYAIQGAIQGGPSGLNAPLNLLLVITEPQLKKLLQQGAKRLIQRKSSTPSYLFYGPQWLLGSHQAATWNCIAVLSQEAVRLFDGASGGACAGGGRLGLSGESAASEGLSCSML